MKKLPVLILMTMSLLSAGLMSVILTDRAIAMGENPSTCSNLYDSAIRSLKINVGSRTIDITDKPNTNFVAALGNGYTVTLTLHSASTSISGNSVIGSVWYGSRAYGFASDQCIDGVNPNTDIEITLHNVFTSLAKRGTVQDVEWYSWPLSAPSVTYTVHWK